VAAGGVITTVAGNGTMGFSGDGGPAASASLAFPGGLALDASSNLFIADGGNGRVRKVSASGIITTVAGNGASGFTGDGGPPTSASLGPAGAAVDASGNLFIADAGNYRIRKVSASGMLTTVAGNGNYGISGDGGPAASAVLNLPSGVAMDTSGNLFIADRNNNRIRKVSAGGIITTFAGDGPSGFSGDGGPATSASLSEPQSIAIDGSGNLFIADAANNRIRKVSTSGVITTVAGSGATGASNGSFSGDGGPAVSAGLDYPTSVAVDASGNLFIADSFNGRVRKVSAGGIVTTVAGNGYGSFSGDGGPATSAFLNFPYGGAVAVDASGNLFIADYYNQRIRKVSASGIITTIAGNGFQGFFGDGGPATSAVLNNPSGVAVDVSGNLFIADSGNGRIRRVSAAGIITTVAGNGLFAFSGNGGPATSAALNLAYGGEFALDGFGNLFIPDSGNNRIREVLAVAPSPSVAAAGITDGAGFSARISAGGIGSIFGTNVALATTSASSLPLPTTLGGTTVILDGIPAPLFFVSPQQLNFQVPWQLLGLPNATLSVITAGGTGPSISVNLSAAAPGIFTINTANSATQGAVQIANSTAFAASAGAISGAVSRPATTGDMLTIYCSGLGAVSNTPASGATAGSGLGLSYVQAQVSVTIGGKAATVLSANLTPGFVGLYQVNVQFPMGVASGSAVPVVVTIANVTSNTATIAVQ